jgi:hypothetical protein
MMVQWGSKHVGVCVYWNTTVIIKKCVHFVGLHSSNCVIMRGMENIKFVMIYQHDPISVLFLTHPGVSMTPASVGQGFAIFAQARSLARTQFLVGFSKINKWKRCVSIRNSSLLDWDSVSLSGWLPKFRRIAAPSSPKTKQSKKILRFVLDCFALKDRGTMIIRNVRTNPHNEEVAHPRRPKSWALHYCQNPKLHGAALRPHIGFSTIKYIAKVRFCPLPPNTSITCPDCTVII